VEFPLTAAAGDSHNDVPMLLAVKKAMSFAGVRELIWIHIKILFSRANWAMGFFLRLWRDFMSLINFY
jgi:phosphoserine phosphatase